MILAKKAGLGALSGWIINLAFPGLDWWFAAPIGLALVWWSLEGLRPAKASLVGFAVGVGFFLPHIWWATVSVGPIPWIALTLLESLAMALFAGVWAYVRTRKLLRGRVALEPIVWALLWVWAEQIRSSVPWGGFPWGRLAFSQADVATGRLAWLGGAVLVSFAVALAGGLLGLAFEALRGRRVVLPALAGLGVVVVLGCGLMVPLDARAESGELRVGVAQGNVPNLGLDSFQQARLVTENHAEVSYALLAQAPWPLDLLIWPENAADIDPRRDNATHTIVTDVAAAAGAPLLLGTIDYVPGGRYNTSLLWTAEGEAIDSYVKQHPAPFAEYIPIRGFARLFSSAVDRVRNDMLAGTEPGVIVLPSTRLDRDVLVGDVICFEIAYDGLVRDTIRAGAEILVVQTNNANFGITAESEQQLAMTRIRAIESGRTTIQSSTVGVSGIIAPDGRVIDSTGLFTQEWMMAEVPLRTSLTPAMRYGGFLDLAFLWAPIAFFAIRMAVSLRGRWEWE